MQITGRVENIQARTTNYGDYYSLQINGKKYEHGKFPPRGIKEGDFVTFDAETVQKGQYTNYNIAKGTLRKDDNAASETTPPPVKAAPPSKQQYVAFDERQDIISKQAALNTALNFCNLANVAGAIPMPKAVKESDKLGLIHKWVLDEAATFYNLSTGRTWELPESAAPADIVKPKAAAKSKAKPEPEEEDTGWDEYDDSDD